jgi:ABC-2 type transport system permease protein
MRLLWEVARRGFARYATYRWATFAGVFTNSIFGFIRAYVFVAVFDRIATFGGYDLEAALTYTFVCQAMLMPLYLWGYQDIAETVYSGQVATDLFRPFDYQLYWWAQDIGRAAYHALMRGVTPFVVGALFFHLRLPHRPETWLVFVVSMALAVSVSYALRFMVNLSAFWLLDIRGVHTIAATAWTLLSGFIVPIAFFPDTLRRAIEALPFVAMLEMPVNVFLERVQGTEALTTLVVQAAWVVFLFGCGRALLAAGSRKLVVQGG